MIKERETVSAIILGLIISIVINVFFVLKDIDRKSKYKDFIQSVDGRSVVEVRTGSGNKDIWIKTQSKKETITIYCNEWVSQEYTSGGYSAVNNLCSDFGEVRRESIREGLIK